MNGASYRPIGLYMKIKFLGTGAAEGVPAIFCNCEYCNKIRFENSGETRTRSQVLIDGCLSIDFPPDAYYHALRFKLELGKLKYIVATHSHMDHFYAHDFILHGYKYAKVSEPVLEIFGDEEVNKVFGECTAREMKKDVAPHLILHKIAPYSRFNAGEYSFLAIPAQHSQTEGCLLYYVEKDGKGYLHLYDTGRIEERAFEYLRDNGAHADLVALDCTFLDYTAGLKSRHMGIEDDMATVAKLKQYGVLKEGARIVITHFSHNCNPTYERIAAVEKQYGVTAAYDGYEIEI